MDNRSYIGFHIPILRHDGLATLHAICRETSLRDRSPEEVKGKHLKNGRREIRRFACTEWN
eukprot:3899533-Ditylum_brightwellii.AAC.1